MGSKTFILDPFLFSDDGRSKRSTSAVGTLNMGDFSGEVEDWMYNKEECKTLECRRVFDNDTVRDPRTNGHRPHRLVRAD